MKEKIKIISVKEVEQSKFISKKYQNTREVVYKGVTLNIKAFTEEGKKCSFFTPVCTVATLLDGSYTERLVNQVGGFMKEVDCNVIPDVEVGDSVEIEYHKVSLYGDILNYKVVRLLNKLD